MPGNNFANLLLMASSALWQRSRPVKPAAKTKATPTAKPAAAPAKPASQAPGPKYAVPSQGQYASAGPSNASTAAPPTYGPKQPANSGSAARVSPSPSPAPPPPPTAPKVVAQPTAYAAKLKGVRTTDALKTHQNLVMKDYTEGRIDHSTYSAASAEVGAHRKSLRATVAPAAAKAAAPYARSVDTAGSAQELAGAKDHALRGRLSGELGHQAYSEISDQIRTRRQSFQAATQNEAAGDSHRAMKVHRNALWAQNDVPGLERVRGVMEKDPRLAMEARQELNGIYNGLRARHPEEKRSGATPVLPRTDVKSQAQFRAVQEPLF